MGPGKWENEYADVLRGASDVVILADNDDAGRKHAREVAATLPGARIVEFSELPEKGDVSDWLDRGHSLDELVRRCDPVRRLTLIDRTISQQMAVENAKPIDAVPTHLPTWNEACLGFGGENDADQVVILDNRNEKRDGFTLENTVRVAKNRHGPARAIPVRWDFRTFHVTEPPVQEFGKVNV